jgi:hypothetical protein
MIEDSLLPFSFPAVGRKKITAAFDGGRITSDAGVMLLGKPSAGSEWRTSLPPSSRIRAIHC